MTGYRRGLGSSTTTIIATPDDNLRLSTLSTEQVQRLVMPPACISHVSNTCGSPAESALIYLAYQ
jgi:hypothetical protein